MVVVVVVAFVDLDAVVGSRTVEVITSSSCSHNVCISVHCSVVGVDVGKKKLTTGRHLQVTTTIWQISEY